MGLCKNCSHGIIPTLVSHTYRCDVLVRGRGLGHGLGGLGHIEGFGSFVLLSSSDS